MPPKKSYGRDDSDDEDDSSEETSTEESSEENAQQQQQRRPVAAAAGPTGASGRGVVNRPHDEEFEVDEGHRKTPPEGVQRKPAPATTSQTITPAARTAASGNVLRNNPNDEMFDVEDDRPVRTPPRGSSDLGRRQQQQQPVATSSGANLSSQRKTSKGNLRNDAYDEFEDVEDDMGAQTATPRETAKPTAKPAAKASAATGFGQGALAPGRGNTLSNDHHDEAIEVSDHSVASTRSGASPQSKKAIPKAAPTGTAAMLQKQSMLLQDDEESSSGGEDSPPHANKAKKDNKAAAAAAQLEYNPADYAHLNARASREVQELFTYITAYHPVTQELPSKLRPFIPDFIPCVGDLDPFCKIPRPDGRPDHLGLHVVDEPCANQSNPAVVKIGLQYTSKQQNPTEFVDSVEDAANRPGVIDKWVSDIKKLHYKKPLPTVNYSKPMPEIEALLQIWPQEFEDLLNSDLQFPPTQIDLDIEQYVRVMCSVLDIPTYGNLVESLHVMFTLYVEFRANQHFQHA